MWDWCSETHTWFLAVSCVRRLNVKTFDIAARMLEAQRREFEQRVEAVQIAREKSYVTDVVIAKDYLSSVTFLFLGINERIARHMHSSVLHMLGIMRVLLPIVSVVIC